MVTARNKKTIKAKGQKNNRWPILAVVYLPPSPGYPGFPGMGKYVSQTMEQVHTLLSYGADGILLENEFDRPYTLKANREVVAVLAAMTARVRLAYPDLYLGVEFLLNDPATSFACALVSGAHFIRSDYWVDQMERPEYGGVMEIDPMGLNHYRDHIGASKIELFADIQVKYAKMLKPRSLFESAQEAFSKRAQAVVVSGGKTGEAIEASELENLFKNNPQGPIFLGSGLCPDNFSELLPWCEGALVGSALMEGGKINPQKCEYFFKELRKYKQKYENHLPRRRWR